MAPVAFSPRSLRFLPWLSLLAIGGASGFGRRSLFGLQRQAMTSQVVNAHNANEFSINDFLNEQLVIYNSHSDAVKYHLFIGNEAADADSIISALAAAHLSYLKDKETDEHLLRAYLPLISVPRDEYPLRKEVETLLGYAGITMGDIVSLHNLSLPPTLAHTVDVTLVDHNVPTPLFVSKLQHYPHQVVQILDHHKDLGGSSHLPSANRIIAFDSTLNKATVASSCTLVFEEFKTKRMPLPNEVALLLCGVILLDSLNLDPKAGKATDRDHSAISSLTQQLSASSLVNYTFSSGPSLFSRLNEIKTDRSYWTSLSSLNVLKYDYKLFPANQGHRTVRVGMSSAMLPLADFLSRYDFMDVATEFIQSHQLDLLVVMTVFSDLASVGAEGAKPELIREIALVGASADMVQALYAYLQGYNGGELQMTALSSADGCLKVLIVVAAKQGNIKASRKQVAPILVDYFESLK
eukprot:gene27850-33631_t